MSEAVPSSEAIPDTLVRRRGPGFAAVTSRTLRCESIACWRPIASELVNLGAGAHRSNRLNTEVAVTLSATNGLCDEEAQWYPNVCK